MGRHPLSCFGMNGKTFSIITLGCKLNQYESECIREGLVRRGWIYHRPDGGADYFIINSCTVTGKTDSRCRNAIRKAKRVSPNATIVITGCYAETQPDFLGDMDEVDYVIGNEHKGRLPAIIIMIEAGRKDGQRFDIALLANSPPEEDLLINGFLDHSRPFVKIQEGCDNGCTYCIIPAARGPSRSVPQETVVRQVKLLERNGYREIVLAGTHIGRYGRDLESGNLETLVSTLLGACPGIRLRLSSIEVTEVTPGLLDIIRQTNRFAPHLHIPLQSGDDAILESMNRSYGAADFSRKVHEVSAAREGISIGTDIIVGFPGETEESFKRTYALVRDLPLTYFHVFSFSTRPGTPAARMPDQCKPETKKRRSRKLIRLGKRKKFAFLRSRVGSRQYALIQGPAHRSSRFSRSITGNYCEVFLKCRSEITGKIVPVTITHYSRGRLYGQCLGEFDTDLENSLGSGR